ncbi:hypothetical protein mRhiFer1_007923 [Rhinolophus ferrumequinum]|uniref:Uncharacterized protein n=1 Tax=Rhinolophus ferrumequinum TaxID=59479 RepID=A0A7J8AUX3_RHIFE|nr:hypothetical protein mRhiFer1_007923 [Rhinolophus ferrumequinum]
MGMGMANVGGNKESYRQKKGRTVDGIIEVVSRGHGGHTRLGTSGPEGPEESYPGGCVQSPDLHHPQQPSQVPTQRGLGREGEVCCPRIPEDQVGEGEGSRDGLTAAQGQSGRLPSSPPDQGLQCFPPSRRPQALTQRLPALPAPASGLQASLRPGSTPTAGPA